MTELAVEAWEYQEAMEDARSKGVVYDESKSVEVQTDKKAIKVVACTGCARALVVNTFYAAGIARCTECKDGSGGTVAAPVPGKTDPAMVEDLKSVLVNPHFSWARCPIHPDDDEHEMELKQVAHSPRHGPRDGVPGEAVLHQCLRCRATVAYSSTAQVQFRRQNEVQVKGDGYRGVEANADVLGVREEEA